VQAREVDAGLAALTSVYRQRMHEALDLPGGNADLALARAARASDAVTEFRRSLVRNPRQGLALERLFLALG
jgi:hypothetical protein